MQNFQSDLPLVQDLVLIGGGHAHALVARAWAMAPLPGVRLTLINPDPVAPYTGMLPGLIAGHYRRDEILIDLVRLARLAGARLILDRVTGIDLAARRIHLQGRPAIDYDLASIDVGITSDLAGLATHAAKPLGAYAEAWERFVATAPAQARVTVIGAGLGGVELALASAHRLPGAQVTLVDRAPPLQGQPGREALLAELSRAGVRFLQGVPVEAPPGALRLADGGLIGSDFTLSVAGGRPQAWLTTTGLALEAGFVTVDARLQTSDPAVFAVGDCAHMPHAPRPKAGVFAVRAAPVLLANLKARLTGDALRDFHPQRDYLKLVSLGDRRALAVKWGMAARGPGLWRLKDRIDRRFMAMFDQGPVMKPPALPPVAGLAEAMGNRPLCGGCGAKLGPGALVALRAALPAPARPEVLSGPGDDAAVLRVVGGVQVLTTDHLRGFTHDPRLMGRLVAVHALGDVWAMGARPQVALAQITLPRGSEALQARMLAEVMGGAAEVFAAAGADVVGGHSAQGAELVVGFTVTGLAERPVTKGGARVGDVLVLTKPLGSGTILAAEMAGLRVPGLMLGEIVASCWAEMAKDQARASEVLSAHAHAMTDVTGFGLAGHLMEMLEASGLAARIRLDALPLMPGYEALAALGAGSSLEPANRAALLGRITGGDLTTPRAAALFDPQTCGGLLAAVPGALADRVVQALGAVVIGEIVPGAPGIALE
ncbi:selenide, water dikinase SelD [Rhodobacter sp. KR11]|uniref:selenide, water dikinase SelD n=1 Tax=Rhodobacter sp. KR11 TaxID=2974588 RepID=UPI002223B92C|nr:selenide, water dikinase SelD [Rhodobacter sp. KR11]MCW1920480.1 selenide, water dikinase SelD [Rhodobacter sp. KR11]